MSFKKHIPNILTCTNLFCGCLAIIAAFKWNLTWASYLIGICALLDFLDGMSSRYFIACSNMGKQLDSLADMVSFGVVPGIIMYQLLGFTNPIIMSRATGTGFESISLIALLIPVFSALRLAKFNIDTRQSDSFIGLPTPANAILICSLPLVYMYDELQIVHYLNNLYFLISLTLLTCYLLISKIPMFSFKFKDAGWVNNKVRYVFLGIALILLVAIHFTAIPIIIFLYIILSIIYVPRRVSSSEQF